MAEHEAHIWRLRSPQALVECFNWWVLSWKSCWLSHPTSNMEFMQIQSISIHKKSQSNKLGFLVTKRGPIDLLMSHIKVVLKLMFLYRLVYDCKTKSTKVRKGLFSLYIFLFGKIWVRVLPFILWRDITQPLLLRINLKPKLTLEGR